MSLIWNRIKHFKPEEFEDPEAPGSWIHMDPETVLGLDRLRETTGWPIVTHNRCGIRGCVCIRRAGHSDNSRHYADHPAGCSAVDFHFVTDAAAREQAIAVLRSGFGGIGIYYDWHWNGRPLPVGFHVDRRMFPQMWNRAAGEYIYLLQ